MTSLAQPTSILASHSSTLSRYKFIAQSSSATIAALETQVASLRALLAEEEASKKARQEEEKRIKARYETRLKEFDRQSRIRELELSAALRGKLQAEEEAAKLRVELERKRQDTAIIEQVEQAMGFDSDTKDRDRAIRTLVQRLRNSQAAAVIVGNTCECEASRALKGLLVPQMSTRSGNRAEGRAEGTWGMGTTGETVGGIGTGTGSGQRRSQTRSWSGPAPTRSDFTVPTGTFTEARRERREIMKSKLHAVKDTVKRTWRPHDGQPQQLSALVEEVEDEEYDNAMRNTQNTHSWREISYV